MKNKVNILGTEYKIEFKDYEKDVTLKSGELSGYCVTSENRIVIADLDTVPYKFSSEKSKENYLKIIIRHEIVHAFFEQSGLLNSCFSYNSSWANNEEMVDWIALQGIKIYKAWEEADAI